MSRGNMNPYPDLRGVPRTGQTSVYDAPDDGTYQAGHPGERFVDLGNGLILDTHLYSVPTMFIKDPSQIDAAPFGTPGSPTTMDWTTAVSACDSLTYAGYNDWRLPNVFELFMLVDLSNSLPVIHSVFDNIQNAGYWSNTTNALTTTSAEAVNMAIVFVNAAPKYSAYYVIPIRGGITNG